MQTMIIELTVCFIELTVCFIELTVKLGDVTYGIYVKAQLANAQFITYV